MNQPTLSAHALTDAVLRALRENPAQGEYGALLEGVTMLYNQHRHQLMTGSLSPREISVLRQMFTQWKAACSLIVKSEQWPDHMPGNRDRAAAFAHEALPYFFEQQSAISFLMMLDNNVFLGFRPSPAMQVRIDGLRFTYKDTKLANAGLAASQQMRGAGDSRRDAGGQRARRY